MLLGDIVKPLSLKGLKPMNKMNIVKPLIDNALKNFYKPGVSDILLDMFNDMNDQYKFYGDRVYINDSDNLDSVFNNFSPSQVLSTVILKEYSSNHAYFAFDGYGHLFSFHFDYFIDMLKDNRDFIDYVVEYVDIATLDELSRLADQDTQKILRDAYDHDVKGVK